MVRYRVVCVELYEKKDVDEWIRCLGIRADDEKYAKLSQKEVIERIQNGDAFYIRASDCGYEEECDIELKIEGDEEKPYIEAPPPTNTYGNPIKDIGCCIRMELRR
jgi:hypothetical protein